MLPCARTARNRLVLAVPDLGQPRGGPSATGAMRRGRKRLRTWQRESFIPREPRSARWGGNFENRHRAPNADPRGAATPGRSGLVAHAIKRQQCVCADLARGRTRKGASKRVACDAPPEPAQVRAVRQACDSRIPGPQRARGSRMPCVVIPHAKTSSAHDTPVHAPAPDPREGRPRQCSVIQDGSQWRNSSDVSPARARSEPFACGPAPPGTFANARNTTSLTVHGAAVHLRLNPVRSRREGSPMPAPSHRLLLLRPGERHVERGALLLLLLLSTVSATCLPGKPARRPQARPAGGSASAGSRLGRAHVGGACACRT